MRTIDKIVKEMKWVMRTNESAETKGKCHHGKGISLRMNSDRCQEIGLVALMFFFELLFSYVSSSISFYVSFANSFSIILFPYLLITRDTQDEGEARFRFY